MLCWRKLKTRQLSIIMDLCLRNIRTGKSHDHGEVIILEKFRF